MEITAIEFFKQMSDPTRLRCLMLLKTEGELCVCELIHAIGESQPKISRHLASLRNAGLVLDRKEGLWVHYRIHPELAEWMINILDDTSNGISLQKPYVSDRLSLSDMPNRPGRACCA
ncbi:MAG: metalloregulator ArsR/SmtB family transcription factor [Gammaproteobacteria bacterium]|nr:metalloregulator ArsR/SmtB family transcription factor [Gammaproteobacteria bacterium]